jgi:hypothetical protein
MARGKGGQFYDDDDLDDGYDDYDDDYHDDDAYAETVAPAQVGSLALQGLPSLQCGLSFNTLPLLMSH